MLDVGTYVFKVKEYKFLAPEEPVRPAARPSRRSPEGPSTPSYDEDACARASAVACRGETTTPTQRAPAQTPLDEDARRQQKNTYTC